ncbi:hypothetical protein INT47_005053 [Mucor saturninus]|uniref:C2H2-type domain-containing protein n=1 Tax=Mucor saturninus TaxID=64648 RepID=A0A8H7UX27_9FUNG|nr:hypothetical protein INT47_005053 [Mucor saturninus]
MQQKRTRNSRPKVFQCTGYGDCKMVFTRSEHLARHLRKHTGEKPFVCIVPLCTKAFSRFDNMMQHTQTHRSNSYNIITAKERHHTRATRAQVKKEETNEEIKKPLQIQTTHSVSSGLFSPVSPQSNTPSPNPKKRAYSYSSCYSSDEEGSTSSTHTNTPTSRRRLSIADLCNPISTGPVCLTKDEYEALEGIGRFRHSPPVFFDSLKDLASQHLFR